MTKADLHIHSTVSDGSVTIAEIIRIAKERELDIISITDHDTISHLSQIPQNTGIRIVAGLEISSYDFGKGCRAHILGYNIQHPEIIEALTQPLLEARHANSMRQIEVLQKHGYSIDIDRLHKADGKYIYKQHIMDYLVETGQAPDMFGDFYKSTFKNKGICDFDIRYIDCFEAVKTIRKAGGKSALAHSGQQQNFYLIPALVECGMDGIELGHHDNSEKDKQIIRQYAAEYGLFLTGGSDFHGIYEMPICEIGTILSDESGIEALC